MNPSLVRCFLCLSQLPALLLETGLMRSGEELPQAAIDAIKQCTVYLEQNGALAGKPGVILDKGNMTEGDVAME